MTKSMSSKAHKKYWLRNNYLWKLKTSETSFCVYFTGFMIKGSVPIIILYLCSTICQRESLYYAMRSFVLTFSTFIFHSSWWNDGVDFQTRAVFTLHVRLLTIFSEKARHLSFYEKGLWSKRRQQMRRAYKHHIINTGQQRHRKNDGFCGVHIFICSHRL